MACKEFDSDIIIRITGDCPLIDAKLINKGIEIFLEKEFDILSVNRVRTYPHGLDFEIFTRSSLEKAWKENLKKFGTKKEFFSTFIPPTKYMMTEKSFRNYDLVNKKNFSNIRLTLDYPEDFEFVEKIFKALYYKKKTFDLDDILDFLKIHPELMKINKMHTKLNNELNIEL
jgi:spore coat polysaccharide biosynthesis protein SpsF